MAKRTTGTKPATTASDTGIQYDGILESANNLKRAIESKNMKELSALLGSSPVWINNRPGSVDKLISMLDTMTGNASDLELTVSKILDTELEGNEAGVTMDCQLVWSNPDTWEEREASFELHIGLQWQDDGWNFTYLAILPKREQPASDTRPHTPPLDVPYFEAAGRYQTGFTDAYFEPYAGAALSYFATDYRSGTPYSYFEEPHRQRMPQASFHAQSMPQAAPPEAGHDVPGYVTVYMPVFVPVSLFKK